MKKPPTPRGLPRHIKFYGDVAMEEKYLCMPPRFAHRAAYTGNFK